MARKLHELLGSQSQVFTQATKVRTDLQTTFDKRPLLFGERIVKFQPSEEGVQAAIESQSSIQSTIAKELRWFTDLVAKALDSEATIDIGNTKAKADVVLDDGTTLLTGLPATQLLQLDKRLGEVLQFVQTVPTLDPAKGFTLAPDRGEGIYIAREVHKKRTRKDQAALVLLAPTVQHPGSAVQITKDVEIGTIVEQEWSSLITPATKSLMLERVEELRRAVKQARARANDIEVADVKIGKTLLDYVFQPVLQPERA